MHCPAVLPLPVQLPHHHVHAVLGLYLVTTLQVALVTLPRGIPLVDWLMSIVFMALTSFILVLVLIWCKPAALPPIALNYWLGSG